MIVDRIGAERHDVSVRHGARVRSDAGDAEVWADIPESVASPGDDASAYLGLALWPAILAEEDLFVDGPVDDVTLRSVRRAAFVLGSWSPALRVPTIDAAEVVDRDATPATGCASFFSRGVDSMFEAALDTRERPPLTHLVFVDGLEPNHSPPTAAAELDAVGAAAEAVGLPLVVTRSNVRHLTYRRYDWANVHGSVLAAYGTLLGGPIGHVVVPSTDSYATLVPYGSHPLLDPLFSTSTVTVHHGDISAGRAGKVAAIAEQRPDLLPHLKVCFAEDRVDNCGRCGKCIITMAALIAVGALDRATGFPDHVDLEAVRALRPAPLQSRWHWVDTVRLLDATGADPALADAIRTALRRASRPAPREWVRLARDRFARRRASLHPSWKDPSRGLDWEHHTEVVRLVDAGRSGRLEHPLPALPERLRRPDA